MRPKELFKAAAEQVQPDSYESASSKARERLEAMHDILKRRTAETLDKVFETFPNESRKTPEKELAGQHWFRCQGAEDAEEPSWGGEVTVTTEPDDQYIKEVTRRWVVLDAAAEMEFDSLVPEGFMVKKRILIGSHDLRFSTDGGETWGEPSKAASIDVVTGLFIEPENETAKQDLEDREVQDPFEHGPVFLERINDRYPVFSERDHEVDLLFSETPQRVSYSYPEDYIHGVDAALDDIENALNGIMH